MGEFFTMRKLWHCFFSLEITKSHGSFHFAKIWFEILPTSCLNFLYKLIKRISSVLCHKPKKKKKEIALRLMSWCILICYYIDKVLIVLYGEFIFKSLQGVKGRKVKAFVHLLNLNCNIIMVRAIEHFSIESHKTKTRVITANRKKRKYL